MRRLNTADVFVAARAVKRSGLREELKKYIAQIAEAGAFDVQDVGIDTMLRIVEVFAEKESEEAIYLVLSGPFEMDPKEVASMSLDVLVDHLEYLSQDGGLLLFFRWLSGILGKS